MKKSLVLSIGLLLGVAFMMVPAPTSGDDPTRDSSEPLQPSAELTAPSFDLSACGCVDVCKSDLQCLIFHGPGTSCEPVGPCACRECVGAGTSRIGDEFASELECGGGEPETAAVVPGDALSACGCVDVCKNDFQCLIFVGPGTSCQPVGPCGCRECVGGATSFTS